MKQIIKRGSFFTLMFMLLGCLSLYAADNDLITEQITIKLEKAGTLPDSIGSSRKYNIMCFIFSYGIYNVKKSDSNII